MLRGLRRCVNSVPGLQNRSPLMCFMTEFRPGWTALKVGHPLFLFVSFPPHSLLFHKLPVVVAAFRGNGSR